MGLVTVDDVPRRYDGPEGQVGLATIVPTLAPVRLKVLEVEIEVEVPFRCRTMAIWQIGVVEISHGSFGGVCGA